MRAIAVGFALAASALSACDQPRGPVPPRIAVAPPSATAPDPNRAEGGSTSTQGARLIATFECARCHEGLAGGADRRSCVSCHEAIRAGRFSARPASLARFQRSIHTFVDVPTLAGPPRFEPGYVASLLLHPHDIRPNHPATMPRLPITDDEARVLDVYLRELATRALEARGGSPWPRYATASTPGDDTARGREVVESRGCVTCHTTLSTGSRSASETATTRPPARGVFVERARRLAPDLRWSAARLGRDGIVRFLLDPSRERPGTSMPNPGLSEREALDVATYLESIEQPPAPTRLDRAEDALPQLPTVDSPVEFAEVRRYLSASGCVHCHADASFAYGDGGAGNTGGFGFAARGVDLSSEEAFLSGRLDDSGARRSLLVPDQGGLARITVVLLARHVEVQGGIVPGVRGMPLGMPPMPVETIARIEAYAQQTR